MPVRARSILVLLAAALAAALAGCPPTNVPQPIPPPPAPVVGYVPEDRTPPPAVDLDAEPPPKDPGGLAAAGEACTLDLECGSGVCEGPGCGAGQGRCAPEQRTCTKDLRAYCGCDGQTFRASGTCPGARYAHAGACR